MPIIIARLWPAVMALGTALVFIRAFAHKTAHEPNVSSPFVRWHHKSFECHASGALLGPLGYNLKPQGSGFSSIARMLEYFAPCCARGRESTEFLHVFAQCARHSFHPLLR